VSFRLVHAWQRRRLISRPRQRPLDLRTLERQVQRAVVGFDGAGLDELGDDGIEVDVWVGHGRG
jgi:hypothetical protein